jgi:hypothetical protein
MRQSTDGAPAFPVIGAIPCAPAYRKEKRPKLHQPPAASRFGNPASAIKLPTSPSATEWQSPPLALATHCHVYYDGLDKEIYSALLEA